MHEIKEKLYSQFQKSGYVVINTNLDDAFIDGARLDLAEYFGEQGEHPVHVPYADRGRIQDAWYISQNVLALAQCATVLDTLETLYRAKARPFQTLNFYKGTQQKVHTDNIHFNSEPFGMMCGVWVALEDIGPDQGPLIYYPGSHNLPEMNYEDFGLTASSSSYPQYLEELQKLILKHEYQPEYGLLKKGQALVWSANIMHGGSLQTNKELTRHSQVTHYYIDDPKCWRPSMSASHRHYFEPDWVRDVSGEPYQFPVPTPEQTALSLLLHPLITLRRVKAAITRRILKFIAAN